MMQLVRILLRMSLAEPEKDTPLAKEKIDYNERFSWTWDQGRIGFGPYGKYQINTSSPFISEASV